MIVLREKQNDLTRQRGIDWRRLVPVLKNHVDRDRIDVAELSPAAQCLIGLLLTEGMDVEIVTAEDHVWEEVRAAFPTPAFAVGGMLPAGVELVQPDPE